MKIENRAMNEKIADFFEPFVFILVKHGASGGAFSYSSIDIETGEETKDCAGGTGFRLEIYSGKFPNKGKLIFEKNYDLRGLDNLVDFFGKTSSKVEAAMYELCEKICKN